MKSFQFAHKKIVQCKSANYIFANYVIVNLLFLWPLFHLVFTIPHLASSIANTKPKFQFCSRRYTMYTFATDLEHQSPRYLFPTTIRFQTTRLFTLLTERPSYITPIKMPRTKLIVTSEKKTADFHSGFLSLAHAYVRKMTGVCHPNLQIKKKTPDVRNNVFNVQWRCVLPV